MSSQSAHVDRDVTRDRLRLAFSLTVAILVIEVGGALLSHSLALFSDAGHVLTDIAAFGLAWFAAVQASKPPSGSQTFGYHRISIVVAFVNGVLLVLIALAIGFFAYVRLLHAETVQPLTMALAAVVPIAINLYIAADLHRVPGENLNVRAAGLHAIGDIGASVGVVVGAVAIALSGATWIDPAISVLIAVLIAFSAVRLIGDTLNVLLDSTPRELAAREVADRMCAVQGVAAVHDLHIWTISSGMRALSCHIVMDEDLPPSKSASILETLNARLREQYHICHTTMQLESGQHEGHDGCGARRAGQDDLFCDLQPLEPDTHSHAHG